LQSARGFFAIRAGSPFSFGHTIRAPERAKQKFPLANNSPHLRIIVNSTLTLFLLKTAKNTAISHWGMIFASVGQPKLNNLITLPIQGTAIQAIPIFLTPRTANPVDQARNAVTVTFRSANDNMRIRRALN